MKFLTYILLICTFSFGIVGVSFAEVSGENTFSQSCFGGAPTATLTLRSVLPSSVPGAMLGFEGQIHNESDALLVNPTLFVRVIALQAGARSGVGFDMFTVKTDVTVPPNGAASTTLTWRVPLGAPAGIYLVSTKVSSENSTAFFWDSQDTDYLGSFFMINTSATTTAFLEQESLMIKGVAATSFLTAPVVVDDVSIDETLPEALRGSDTLPVNEVSASSKSYFTYELADAALPAEIRVVNDTKAPIVGIIEWGLYSLDDPSAPVRTWNSDVSVHASASTTVHTTVSLDTLQKRGYYIKATLRQADTVLSVAGTPLIFNGECENMKYINANLAETPHKLWRYILGAAVLVSVLVGGFYLRRRLMTTNNNITT